MASPVTLTSQLLNKIVPLRKRWLGRKLARVVNEGGHSFAPRRYRKFDTEEKIIARVNKLARKGAALDETHEGFMPLEVACFWDRPAVARRLLELGARVNQTSDCGGSLTPLMRSVQNANVGLTRLLLENGANPNIGARNTDTIDMVIQAANSLNVPIAPPPRPAEGKECLKLMLQYGLAPDQAQKRKLVDQCPLLARELPDAGLALGLGDAVAAGDLRAVRALLANGLHPDAAHDYGLDTPLAQAAANGNVAVMDLLLSHGAKIDLPSPVMQYTPLQAATFNGQEEAFVALLQRGADPRAPCAVQYNARLDQIAKRSPDPRMAEFIQNALDTIAEAPAPANPEAAIKVNKPLRLKVQKIL